MKKIISFPKRIWIFSFIDAVVFSGIFFNNTFEISKIATYIIDFCIIFCLASVFYILNSRRIIKMVELSSDGINDGKTLILWQDVQEVSLENFYMSTITSSSNRVPFFDLNKFKFFVAKAIKIKSTTGEEIVLNKNRKTVKSVSRFVDFSKHSQAFNDNGSNILTYTVGNLKLVMFTLLSAAIISVMPFVILYFSGIVKALIITASLFLCFSKLFFMRFGDAFSVNCLCDGGIKYQGEFIAWDDVKNISFNEARVKFIVFNIKFGVVISVNTEYTDTYLGEHSPRCAYIYYNKKNDSIFTAKCPKYTEVKRKYGY